MTERAAIRVRHLPAWASGTATIAAFALAALIPGCGRREGAPPIASDAECAGCGMTTSAARFACERHDGKHWRVFDSIECLMQDAGAAEARSVWLPDYDQARLHRADSLWVVKGRLSTPMGGGLVAFLDRAVADSVAAASHGRVTRWGDPALAAEERP
jgi:nitrous oxide reductase accessory protein NosL